MSKKLIGIPGWKVGDNSYGVTSTYLEFFSQFGDVKIIMKWENPEEVSKQIDLLVLTGGMDVAPSSYGESPGYTTSNVDVFKQHFYDNCLDVYIRNNVPIFGICLGAQQIGAKFGQKLVQNLPWHAQSAHRWEEGHQIFVIKDRAMGKGATIDAFAPILGCIKKKYEVNSHHHQGLSLENWNEHSDLLPIIVADDLKVVEAVIHKNLPIVGLQWHPEEWYDTFSVESVKFLLDYKTITKGKNVENTLQAVS